MKFVVLCCPGAMHAADDGVFGGMTADVFADVAPTGAANVVDTF